MPVSRANDRLVQANIRSCAVVRVWLGERTFSLVRLARERMITQRLVNARFLSMFSTIEEVSANDCPRMGECSLPQCVWHFGEDFCERSPKDGRTFASSVCQFPLCTNQT
jgi:hypothetical protein